MLRMLKIAWNVENNISKEFYTIPELYTLKAYLNKTPDLRGNCTHNYEQP